MNDQIFRKWKKAGIAFAAHPAQGDIDIEMLLLETTIEGRSNSRLLSAMASWLIHYGDLVCSKRLSSNRTKGNSALLAGVIEYVLSKGADKKLSIVLPKCKKQMPEEFLFPEIAKSAVVRQYQSENADPCLKKWGFITSDFGTLEDALHTREYVLERNKNLALRAIFGPGARADIMYWLSKTPSISIHRLAMEAGYSYEPIYSEIKRLIMNNLIVARQEGRKILISLTDPSKAFLKHLPV